MAEHADRYFDERIETLPPELLRKLQDHRLRWQFRRCWDGSAWYRARFEGAGLTPETFSGLADLTRLPLLSRDELAACNPMEWLVAPMEWIRTEWHFLGRPAREETTGDQQHESDRGARTAWAAVTWESRGGWPRLYYQERHRHRRSWPSWLDKANRTATRSLHDRYVGFDLAFQCIESSGRHWADDQLLAEIVDPNSGQPAADGTAGELVVTDLVREANPLIRYRTGLRRILTHEPCACGRTSSLIWTAQAFRAAQHARS